MSPTGVDLVLLGPSTSIATGDGKVLLPIIRVKWIVDRHDARIAGIILGRIKALPSLNIAQACSWRSRLDRDEGLEQGPQSALRVGK